jgi:hypothetical protein
VLLSVVLCASPELTSAETFSKISPTSALTVASTCQVHVVACSQRQLAWMVWWRWQLWSRELPVLSRIDLMRRHGCTRDCG